MLAIPGSSEVHLTPLTGTVWPVAVTPTALSITESPISSDTLGETTRSAVGGWDEVGSSPQANTPAIAKSASTALARIGAVIPSRIRAVIPSEGLCREAPAV